MGGGGYCGTCFILNKYNMKSCLQDTLTTCGNRDNVYSKGVHGMAIV